jgi:hypothetical protein
MIFIVLSLSIEQLKFLIEKHKQTCDNAFAPKRCRGQKPRTNLAGIGVCKIYPTPGGIVPPYIENGTSCLYDFLNPANLLVA